MEAGSPGQDRRLCLEQWQGRAGGGAAGSGMKSHHDRDRQLGCKVYGMNSAVALTSGYLAQNRLGCLLKPGGLCGKTDLYDGIHLEPVRDQTMLWQVETA